MTTTPFILLVGLTALGAAQGPSEPVAQAAAGQASAAKVSAPRQATAATAEASSAQQGTAATTETSSSGESQGSWFDELDDPEYLPSRFNLSLAGGLGLIRALSPYSLPSGEIVGSFATDNFDRNPGDIDVVEVPFQGAIGLPGRTEFFVKYTPVLRTNSVGQHPVEYPVPPLDLFVDVFPSNAQRAEPYFLFAQEYPYKTYAYYDVTIDPPGNGAFASSSGDIVLGLKANLTGEDRGHWAGFGVRGYWEIPTETPEYNSSNWAKLAGVSGESNWGFDLMFSKAAGRAEFLVNAGYKWTGDPSRGLRVQTVDSSKDTSDEFLVGEPVEIGLTLRNQVPFTFGVNLRVFHIGVYPVYFMGEFTHLAYVGGGTPVERKVHPNELRLGLQFTPIRSVSVGFVWQLLLNDAGDGGTRVSNLIFPDGSKGDINFSELVDPALAEEVTEYFRQYGATFSSNSSKVFSTNNAAFDSWRNISTEPQTIIGQGGGNFLLLATWRIGKLW